MKEYCCLYTGESEFKEFLTSSGLDSTSNFLVFLFSCGLDQQKSVAIAATIKSLLPYSEIAGATSSSVCYKGEITTNCMLVRIVYFEKSHFQVKFLPHKGKNPADLSLDIVGNMCDQKTKALVLQVSGLFPNLGDFLDEFNKLVPNIVFTGGPVTSDKSFFWGFVFNEQDYYLQHFMVVVFSGESLYPFAYPLNNVEPIGDIYEISKIDGNKILEISGTPAIEFINDVLGVKIETYDDCGSLLDRFPFVLVDRCNSTRQLVYDSTLKCLRLLPGFSVREGERIRCSYMSSRIAYVHYSNMIDELNLFPTQVLWGYCCFSRAHMYPTMHTEISRFFMPRKLSISYVAGEFGNEENHNEFYSGTVSYLGLTEDMDANVVNLDKTKLRQYASDDNDTSEIFKYLLMHQSEEVLTAKEELLKKIADQEKKATISLFVDKNTGMYNIEKYSYDTVRCKFNKLAMVVIEKSVQLSNYFGTAEYINYYMDNVNLFMNYLKEFHCVDDDLAKSKVCVYFNDLSSFIIVSGAQTTTEEFMELMRRLFMRFNKHYTHSDVVCMNNFFIVVDQDEELLEKAKLLLAEKKNALKRFVVYEERVQDVENFEESLAALSVVNYAIEHDGIEPYFQPIYDNSCGCTYKFESLMRIKDANGKLWFPNQFLPVAKEFRLYLQLSCAMINKVFELFDNRCESVSINLSAIDINSEMVTNMIYSRLGTLKNPSHFIFEILESDAFEDLDVLSNFIKQLRTFNVMIAIDDFGAGYSNLLEIVKLKPDLIKIDGEIIKHLLHDEVNRNIIDVIIFLAKRFSVDLVAEYAESKELQEFLESKGIRYSQGYYFSKPLPYDQIDSYLESERRAREEHNKN